MSDDDPVKRFDDIAKAPRIIRPLIRQFPPGSLVRSIEDVDHGVPAAGDVARVVGWNGGSHTVRVANQAGNQDWCHADHLEVVEYAPGFTPEELTGIWAAADEDSR